MFTHVLMTRFNLATPGKELAIRTKPGWLEHRFALFETYCLPSVAAQTSSDFRWIVFFDKDTPEAFKTRVDRLSERGRLFTPYYTGLFPGTGWGRAIHEVLTPNIPLLLTTRLDNDDSLAADFVARLHREVAARDYALGIYNFRQGAIARGPQLYTLAHDSAPFFSLLEPLSDSLCTAPNIHHMRIADAHPVMQIDGAIAWMQIVHDTNVSNRIRGRRVQPDAVAGLFPAAIAGQLRPVSGAKMALDRYVTAPFRTLRDGALEVFRGKHMAK